GSREIRSPPQNHSLLPVHRRTARPARGTTLLSSVRGAGGASSWSISLLPSSSGSNVQLPAGQRSSGGRGSLRDHFVLRRLGSCFLLDVPPPLSWPLPRSCCS